MKEKVLKIVKTVVNVLLWVFLGFVSVVAVLAFVARANNADLPQLGGYYFMSVQSESMTGTFNKGDVIVVKAIYADDVINLESGKDVISFYMSTEEGKIVNSHRIIEKIDEGNGVIKFRTQGDANELPDGETLTSSKIIGKWTGVRIIGLGSFIDFLQSTWGLILLIILPMSAFLIYQLVDFIKAINSYRNKDKVTMTLEEQEMIKQQAILEYLEKQKQQENKDKKE